MGKLEILNGIHESDMAVIMTAYQDFSFIKYNVEHLHKGFDVYIHVDKKRAIPQEFIDYCRALRNIWIDSRFRINWGGYEHLKAILYLLFFASSVKEYKRYVIMSENEASLYTVESIKNFLNLQDDKNFIGMADINGKDNSEDRINSYHFQYKYDIRDKSVRGIVKSYFWRSMQVALRTINIRPHYKHNYRYKGYVYCALNNVAMSWLIVNHQEVSEAVEESKYLYVPEEYVLQNLLMESETIRDSIVNDSLIFDDWTKPELGTPRLLMKDDLDNIILSEKLFFRKIGTQSDLKEYIYTIER